MAEQWQIRRGTTAENDDFTGAVGELTMDTDKKQIRLHDGETQGGVTFDPVVVFIKPTAENDYIWARKYASGWVEQGGSTVIPNTTNAWATTQISLPIEMANARYQAYTSSEPLTSGAYGAGSYFEKGVSSMIYHSFNMNGAIDWYVCGMAA